MVINTIATIPDDYQAGWYRFDSSTKIKQGKIYSYHYFAKSLVCYRDKKGIVNIFDAHCPHLGAHLGVGGKIVDDKLICPFHGWQYNSAGQCVTIPYCKVIPKKAILQRYESQEYNGVIYIRYQESIDLLALPDLCFKNLSTLETTQNKLDKCLRMAPLRQLNFQSIGPGFLFESNQQLLISVTPIDIDRVILDFSFSYKKSFHLIQRFSIKRKAKKKFNLLLS